MGIQRARPPEREIKNEAVSTDRDERVLVIDGLEYHKWDRKVFENIRAGDITAINATCAIWEDARATLDNIGRWHRLFEEHSDLMVPAVTGDDIRSAYKSRKTAIILGFQNSSPIENNINLVGVFAALGVRIIQLTYNNQNLVGSGCYEDEDPGLSYYGRGVIKEMNRLGVLVDLSHVGERTSLDTIEISSQPVAITHANPVWAKAVHRNKSDTVLRALAESGGVLGLAAYPVLLSKGIGTTLRDFCDMAARTVDMIGIDHVAIGTDHHLKFSPEERQWWRRGQWSRETPAYFDLVPMTGGYGEGGRWTRWFQSPADMPNIVRGLREHGFSPTEVAAIMGGNWLRLFDQVFLPGGKG